MSEDCFGPALPPGFSGRSTNKNVTKETPVGKHISGIGPQLPPHLKNPQKSSPDSSTEEEEALCIGPSLPPHLKLSLNHTKSSIKSDIGPSRTSQSKSDDNSSVIGPALPPHLSKKHYQSSVVKDKESDACISIGQSSKQDSIIGPSLPPHLQRNVQPASFEENVHDAKIDDHDDTDDDVIGPLPSEMSAVDSGSDFSAEFERRARKMKDHLDGKSQSDGQPKREAWMMELPDCMGQNIGLTARTFRVNAGPDLSDRSMWTDSPADRARKEKEGHTETRKRPHSGPGPSGRDQQIRTELETYNKARGTESLLDMHQKKWKKQQKEESSKPKERRPFDRDLDLQANRFDDAQRKAIIKKSQNLNSRFGHSKDSQYL